MTPPNRCLATLLVPAVAWLTACGSVPQTGEGGRGLPATECTARVIVTVRQNSMVRNDTDFIDLMNSLGIDASVLHNMSRNARMVRIYGRGPDSVCRELMDQLRLDPRIEAANPA